MLPANLGGDGRAVAGKPVRADAGAKALDTSAQPGEPLRTALQRSEAVLRRALDDHDGRRAATARTLGITQEGLYKKLKRYGIEWGPSGRLQESSRRGKPNT